MSLLQRKVRGFRLIDVVAFSLLVLLVMSVYLAMVLARPMATVKALKVEPIS